MPFDKKTYDAKWQAENTERIVIKPNKALFITNRINYAISRGYPGKRQTYIIDAICEKLERDGITIESLHLEDIEQ